MKNLPIELEVDTLEQLKEGLELDVDGILLDNMSTEMVKEAVSIIRDRPGGMRSLLKPVAVSTIRPLNPTPGQVLTAFL